MDMMFSHESRQAIIEMGSLELIDMKVKNTLPILLMKNISHHPLRSPGPRVQAGSTHHLGLRIGTHGTNETGKMVSGLMIGKMGQK